MPESTMITTRSYRGSDLALCFTVTVLLLFVVCTTVFMALQSRQTVAQSRRMDELEKLTKLLHQRVETLERQLAATNSTGSEQGKEKDTSFRPDKLELSNKNKASNGPDRRSRRQFSSFCPCIQGPPGPPGPPGDPGKHGQNGSPGPRGRPGRPGKSGKDGVNGTRGAQGPRGDQGPVGPSGFNGTVGPRGDKGETGIRGPPGPVVSAESIHLVGNGGKVIQPDVSHSITQWSEPGQGQSQGSIRYHKETGSIVINTSGYYFVYSQIFYCGKNQSIVGYVIVVNNEPKMKNVWSIEQGNQQHFNAKYQGSLLRLVSGDNIKVKAVSENTMYCMNSKASYFGAFLVRPLYDGS